MLTNSFFGLGMIALLGRYLIEPMPKGLRDHFKTVVCVSIATGELQFRQDGCDSGEITDVLRLYPAPSVQRSALVQSSIRRSSDPSQIACGT